MSSVNTVVNAVLEEQVRRLIEFYRSWNGTKASILVGAIPPVGSIGEKEHALYLDKNSGRVYHAAEGGVWKLVADMRGPTGDAGPTGPTGPCWRGKKDRDHNSDCSNSDCDGCSERQHKCCYEGCGKCRSCKKCKGCSRCKRKRCGPPSNHYYESDHHHRSDSEYRHYRDHPLGERCIPKITQAEAINITPQGLSNAVISLSAIPANCNASIDVSFCGSFTNAINALVDTAPSKGRVVINASTNIWSVSMTVDFIEGQNKWSGAFNRALSLIPGTQNKIFITVGYQSNGSQTGVSLSGANDFISARLIYDI